MSRIRFWCFLSVLSVVCGASIGCEENSDVDSDADLLRMADNKAICADMNNDGDCADASDVSIYDAVFQSEPIGQFNTRISKGNYIGNANATIGIVIPALANGIASTLKLGNKSLDLSAKGNININANITGKKSVMLKSDAEVLLGDDLSIRGKAQVQLRGKTVDLGSSADIRGGRGSACNNCATDGSIVIAGADSVRGDGSYLQTTPTRGFDRNVHPWPIRISALNGSVSMVNSGFKGYSDFSAKNTVNLSGSTFEPDHRVTQGNSNPPPPPIDPPPTGSGPFADMNNDGVYNSGDVYIANLIQDGYFDVRLSEGAYRAPTNASQKIGVVFPAGPTWDPGFEYQVSLFATGHIRFYGKVELGEGNPSGCYFRACAESLNGYCNGASKIIFYENSDFHTQQDTLFEAGGGIEVRSNAAVRATFDGNSYDEETPWLEMLTPARLDFAPNSVVYSDYAGIFNAIGGIYGDSMRMEVDHIILNRFQYRYMDMGPVVMTNSYLRAAGHHAEISIGAEEEGYWEGNTFYSFSQVDDIDLRGSRLYASSHMFINANDTLDIRGMVFERKPGDFTMSACTILQ